MVTVITDLRGFLFKTMERNMKDLDKVSTAYELKQFEGLCDRAKMFVFDWLLSNENSDACINAICNSDILNNKLSPIEQIFNVCYHRYVSTGLARRDIDGVPLAIVFMTECVAQKEISVQVGTKGTFKEVIYIADFVIDFALYPSIKNLKYVIELDGHEYHSDKKQVNSDYEREQNLQAAGYKVIRFTGSQIYNKPFECVEKLITIIVQDIKKTLGD